MGILLHPYALISIAALFVLGWSFNQGRHFEQRKYASAQEATNKRIRAVNEREEKVAAKEEEQREKAFSAATPLLLKAGRCEATPEVAAALSSIR